MFGPNQFIDIELKGIDADVRGRDHVCVYGVRSYDTARRLVGVAVTQKMAMEIAKDAEFLGHFPTIEVPDRSWFYVAVLGPSHFEKGDEPS